MFDTEKPISLNGEQSVQDVILEMLDQDSGLNAGVRDAVLSALAAVDGGTGSAQTEHTPTYLSAISVAGFRGIGRQARLDLYPVPGLMVVSGRNGSGKSSFAEALELALTGTSYRWHKKGALWAESWQNLHDHDPCAIRIGFAAEGSGPFTVGVDWEPASALAERSTWTQCGSEKRLDGTGELGWRRPLELWRPVLSYDELGRLFDDGPSALHDAMAKLLGLETLAEAEKWLAGELKSTKESRTRADEERKRLQSVLAGVDDERAKLAATLLGKRGKVSLDGVHGLLTGSRGTDSTVVSALRELAQLETPDAGGVELCVAQLREAEQNVVAASVKIAEGTRNRIELLEAALRLHDDAGDMSCPVCGDGHLDIGWATQTRATVSSSETDLNDYRLATTTLKAARVAATRLLDDLQLANAPDGVELISLDIYNDAVAAAQHLPDGDSELADHVEIALAAAIEASALLRAQASESLAGRESSWLPLAAQLSAWVDVEQAAREVDDHVKSMTAAKKWMADHGAKFRNLRLEPVAEHARRIWAQLRQESNVDLGAITLQGTGKQRKVVLGGSVDGEPTKALSVMSQGELHALALALFLPRATSAESPFRFVVLDDPIQAMDPAKVDGFVKVLNDIAKTHQVIVFSHDDRLASVIRETGIDARLVEVVRESGSKVSVRDNINPALRQVNDVFALVKDDRLSPGVKAKVLPGLCRIALESAAQQSFYARQALAGRPRAEFEAAWQAAKKTRVRLALAVHGDASTDVTGWLKAKPARDRALRLCNAVHDGAAVGIHDARDLEKTIEEVLALR